MTLLLVYGFLALAISSLCSLLEAVLLSLTPGYIASLEEHRPRVGKRLSQLKTDIDRPLAAILSLNTIAHTVGAAGVGAQAQKVFGEASLAITSAVLTVLILVVSEIVPKTLGASYWKKLAPWSARVLLALMLVLGPFVWLTRLLSRWLAPKEPQRTVEREEFTALADLAVREGLLDENESVILRNLLRFGDLRGKDVMTPRTVMVAFDERQTVEAVMDRIDDIPFSRLPVYNESIDNITGFVLKQDVLARAADDEYEVDLTELRRDLLALPSTTRLPLVFERMLTRKEHLVLMQDEYGGSEGLVTLEDIVETLLGFEIVDETDKAVDMRALARRQWERRAQRWGLRVEPARSAQ